MTKRPIAAACGALLAWLALGFATPVAAFDYFEHRFIGNMAYQRALATLASRDEELKDRLEAIAIARLGFGRPAKSDSFLAARLRSQLPLQFGDLSALAGDFAKDEKDLKSLISDMIVETDGAESFFASNARALIIDTRRQWISACKWAYRTRGGKPGFEANWENCFSRIAGAETQNAEPRSQFGAAGYVPSREELAEHEAIPNYISLASQNRDHFPRYSWKAYSDAHSRALALARCYRDGMACKGAGQESVSGEALLIDAVYYEAFAQHYLHDSFAAGHIGTKYGFCLFAPLGLMCSPTKRRMELTHNSLNELGLDVSIANAPDFLQVPTTMRPALVKGFTVFGDDHLFIREADFQRELLVHTASRSIAEVLDAASNRIPSSGSTCEMCKSTIFPIPDSGSLSAASRAVLSAELTGKYEPGHLVEFEGYAADERSKDPRLAGAIVEGWKVSFAVARQNTGKAEGGGSSEAAQGDNGMLLKLDYLRNTGFYSPNSLGFEYWSIPDRGSAYLFAFGWQRPREVSALSIALKGKIGWRTEENFTRTNSSSERRGGLEMVFPAFEVTYELFRPLALFFQFSVAGLICDSGQCKPEYSWEGKGRIAAGLRFDLGGI